MRIELTIEAIAFVRESRQDARDDHWGGSTAIIELAPHVPEESLRGIEAFSHAEILFVFDRVTDEQIVWGTRHPRNNPAWPEVGIFAQRGKMRPNRLGSTIAPIVRREGTRLFVAELDAMEGTPVVDIKPVMREFLPRREVHQPDWATELMERYWLSGAR